jgi:hypothetical protein
MKKVWYIWDFPDTVYIYLRDDFREKLFESLFERSGGKRPYAKFLELNQMTVKRYHRGYFYKKGIKYRQSIPVRVIKKSLPIMDDGLKEKLEENIVLLKAKGKSIPIVNPRLPFEESTSLYRIVAHLIGDGSAPKNHVPYYANTCKELRDQFKEDLKIFGEVRVYDASTNTTPIVCFPKVIADILSHVLDVRFSFPDRIPRNILCASEECKREFLKALFDDEGCCSTGVFIRMKSQDLIKQISNLLEHIEIKVNKILVDEKNSITTLSINSKSIEDFRDKVGFAHPNKSHNLNSKINARKRSQRTRSKDIIEGELIGSLNDGGKTTLEIANNIQLTLGHTLKHLKKLENKGKIRRSGYKNKALWSAS